MILIFGGTTEGRIAANVCDCAGKKFFYSTKNGSQNINVKNGCIISGAMDSASIVKFCADNNIKLIINAAHPFANELHNNISSASVQLKIDVIRLERGACESDYKGIIRINTIVDAVDYILSHGIKKVLALSGVNSAKHLTGLSGSCDVFLRIMNLEESNRIIKDCGFPIENIIYYDINDDSRDVEVFNKVNPDLVIIKESGESGGFEDKIKLAEKFDIPVLLLSKPKLREFKATVFGEVGLRKNIENLLPGFFNLRIGFTTGTCATAAACAALITVLSKTSCDSVEIDLPKGERVKLNVKSNLLGLDSAVCSIIKDAGDDPDVTNNIEIIASVKLNKMSDYINIIGGEGVGRVTLPGLGLDIGEPAINRVPRECMIRNIELITQYYGYSLGVDVEISVPKGKEIAQRTFNKRLGIIDGISILGTSGVVRPFSNEAFIESIQKQIEISKAINGGDIIVINSGAKSERYMKALYPHLDEISFVHYGNLIGETIKLAAANKIKSVVMGIMIGKAVKLASGKLDTHSKNSLMDKEYIAAIAKKANCCNDIIDKIYNITTANQIFDLLPPHHRFFTLIKQECYNVCKPLLPEGELTVVVIPISIL